MNYLLHAFRVEDLMLQSEGFGYHGLRRVSVFIKARRQCFKVHFAFQGLGFRVEEVGVRSLV